MLTRKISALPVQPHGDAPNHTTPEVKKTAGLGALALGGLAVYGARRRRNV